MTDGAIVAIDLLASGERLRAGLDRIALIRRFRSDLVPGGWSFGSRLALQTPCSDLKSEQ